jgi:hypothetical protein
MIQKCTDSHRPHLLSLLIRNLLWVHKSSHMNIRHQTSVFSINTIVFNCVALFTGFRGEFEFTRLEADSLDNSVSAFKYFVG